MLLCYGTMLLQLLMATLIVFLHLPYRPQVLPIPSVTKLCLTSSWKHSLELKLLVGDSCSQVNTLLTIPCVLLLSVDWWLLLGAAQVNSLVTAECRPCALLLGVD